MVLESFKRESEIDTRSEIKVKGNIEKKVMENSFGENRKKTQDRKLMAKDNIHVE